jgi:hypothetical protein
MDERRKAILRTSLIMTACLLAVSIVGVSVSLLQTSVSVPSTGEVRTVGVGVYWNSACTNRTTTLTWGTLAPGSAKTIAVYVRNEGNTGATLSKSVRNWVPSSAPNYFAVSWNYANQTIAASEVQPVSLTLSVASNVTAITNFTFDLTITASG